MSEPIGYCDTHFPYTFQVGQFIEVINKGGNELYWLNYVHNDQIIYSITLSIIHELLM